MASLRDVACLCLDHRHATADAEMVAPSCSSRCRVAGTHDAELLALRTSGPQHGQTRADEYSDGEMGSAESVTSTEGLLQAMQA